MLLLLLGVIAKERDVLCDSVACFCCSAALVHSMLGLALALVYFFSFQKSFGRAQDSVFSTTLS